jgi:hypothetical protein
LLDLRVDPTETITSVKTRKAGKFGIEAEKFKLKVGNTEISDES